MNQSKKVALLNIFSGVPLKRSNPRALHAFKLKELYEAQGHIFKFITKVSKAQVMDDRVDHKNEMEFDEIIYQFAPVNFHGGAILWDQPETGQWLVDQIKEGAQIKLFSSDPCIKPWVNPLKEINVKRKREYFNKEDIAILDDVLKCSPIIFPAMFDHSSVSNFFSKELTNPVDTAYNFNDTFRDIDYSPTESALNGNDLIYYGGNRMQSFRKNNIKKYITRENDLLVGYPDKDFSCHSIKRVNHWDIPGILDQCKATLVIGDKGHLDNVIPFRFYEGMASNALCAIDIQLDPKRLLIKDEELRDLLYVNSSEDVDKILRHWSPRLVEKQQSELKRILK